MSNPIECKELALIKRTIENNGINIIISKIQKIGEGWMSLAYLVNDHLVFRFPKEADGGKSLEKEKKALPYLQKCISLKIPEFAYFGLQENGLPFTGYNILPGVPLNDLYEEVPLNVRQKIARPVANFIKEISSVPYEIAKELELPENDFYKEYFNTLEEIKGGVFDLLSTGLKDYISNQFSWYLNNKKNFEYVPTVLHGDLSTDHLLFDSNTEELVGVIDFGDLELGDPDYEYLYLLDDFGLEFTKDIMELRGEKNIDSKIEKISFFMLVDNIGIITEGIHRNDNKMIESGISFVKNELENR